MWRNTKPNTERSINALKGLIITCVLLCVILSFQTVSAVPIITAHDGDCSGPDAEFEIKITVEADGRANYTVIIQERPQFEIIGVNQQTKDICKGDKVLFSFKAKANNDTSDGDYNFEYKVLKDDTQIESGTLKVIVGRGGEGKGQDGFDIPCVDAILVGIIAIGYFAVVLIKRRE